MKDIFYPSSVAVVGVSWNPENLGRNIVLNLVDFGFAPLSVAKKKLQNKLSNRSADFGLCVASREH